MENRKIIHFDMDYFYAQVEERDNPSLKNKPVAIGGLEKGRGVLCTCNYIAREFGVRSAMPSFKAIKLCPDLIIIHPNMKKYRQASEEVFKIFLEYTDIIQSISLDEAYLDVTNSSHCYNSATWMAHEIKQKIYQRTGLTGSAGVSYNKLLSKISSDINKPNGLYVIPPGDVSSTIDNFLVNKIWGVGKVTNEKMKNMGIKTFKDLQKYSKLDLVHYFGSFGPSLYDYCRGVDLRDVDTERERKSVSVEHTFSENISGFESIEPKLDSCFIKLQERLENCSDKQIKSIFVKIKYSDFNQTTIETQRTGICLEKFKVLFQQRYSENISPVRLLGLGVKFFTQSNSSQLALL